jgi:hypothetical protein
MAGHYYNLTADELKEARELQLEVVRTATPDDYLDAYHKLSVMESLIAWHAAEAFRSGGAKVKTVKGQGKKTDGRSKARKPSSWSQISIGRASR